MSDKPMSILDHLQALRRVLIVSLISVLPGAVIGWYIRDHIFELLVRPVKSMNYSLVYIGATEAFTAELKIAFYAGLVIASPVIAYQFWRFLLPALYANEKKYILTLVPLSLLLFAGGVVFAYYTVYNYGIQFLLSFGGEGLTPMLSLGKYLSFSVWFLLPFGLIFEMPLVLVAMARLGIITPAFLAKNRRWALILAFVISAIVTPTTDMLTQGVMGLAMYLLYEVSVWISYLVFPKRAGQLAAAGGPDRSAEVEEPADSALLAEKAPKANITPEDTITEAPDSKNGEQDSPQDAPKLEDIYNDIVDRGRRNDS